MLYRVVKDKGVGANITLMNMDTGATLMIGRASVEIFHILEEAGYTFGREDKDIKVNEPWSLDVDSTIAKMLQETAFKMRKPNRIKRDIPEKKTNKEIDAMDVLLGLANYN